MNRCIVQIWGHGYSGSSILNLVLDSYDWVRGLGEANRVWQGTDGARPCSICQQSDNDFARDCRFWEGINPYAFYSECFRRYPGAYFLVDATKFPSPMIERQVLEPEFSYCRILLTKYPHEFAESYFRHNSATVEEAFRAWIAAAQSCLEHEMPTVAVSYRALMGQPGAIDAMARSIGIKGGRRRKNWWETDSHIVGGNWAARAQVNGHYAWYLDSTHKYNGRRGALFVDDAWRRNPALCRHAIECYEQFRNELEPILARLELPQLGKMIEECHEPLCGGQSC